MTDHLNGNGQPKGRAVPALATFTFANGVVAQLRPISQFTRAHIETQARKQHPAPKPPPASAPFPPAWRRQSGHAGKKNCERTPG